MIRAAAGPTAASADDGTTTARLVTALRDLARHTDMLRPEAQVAVPGPGELRLPQVCLPRDAYFSAMEGVPLDKAAGRTAAEIITLCPPGIPVVLPGEQLTEPVLADVDPSAYDLLLVPGGTLNADALRGQDAATGIVRSFASSGRPVAAICHGPWALVEADVVAGKKLTSYSSLKTDIRNAGGEWTDEPVVTDDAQGWTLITSRNPGDLQPFLREVESALAVTTQ
ncbi:DJ-1/PfpI family protein [Streptomyces sp. NPDC053720]|uniref:DJ-1/PfpI family protein n=1 Tax=Streptomyces sp. NPDC053720 TaxID=3154855 RepID=UPI0034275210